MPVTWRNINAPNLNGGAQSIASAGASFQRALDGVDKIGQVFDQAEKKQTSDNTAAFLNAVNKEFTTPEALRAAQLNGELDAFRNAFGGDLDQTKTDSFAVDGLVNRGQDQAIRDQQYTDQQSEVANRGIRDEVARLQANGDLAGAQAILDNNNLQGEDKLYAGLTAASRNQEADARAETRFVQGNQQFANSQKTFANRQADRLQSLADDEVNRQYLAEEREREASQRYVDEERDLDDYSTQNITNEHINRALGKDSTTSAKTLARDLAFAGIPHDMMADALNNFNSVVEGVGGGNTLGKKIAKLQNEYLPQSVTAQYFANPVPPQQAAAEILKNQAGPLSELTAGDRKQAIKTMNQALAGEYEYGGKKLFLPPAVIENAIAQTTDTGFFSSILKSTNRDLDEVIDYMLKNDSSLQADIELGQEYKNKFESLTNY